MPRAAQTQLQCQACGGQCAFDPAQGALVCGSCGHARKLKHISGIKAAAETDYHPDDPNADVPQLAQVRAHSCQTCGAQVVFEGPTLSERCTYCDGPVVLSGQDTGYRSTALIPFQLTADHARGQIARWIAGRWAAPRGLAQAVAQGRLAPLYTPFFTFDSDEAIQYWGSYRVKRGKSWTTKRVRGQMRTNFDDLLVPASPHITPLIRDGVLHDFRPETLRPYHPGYLAGFAAERHHLSVAEGLEANAADKDLLIRNRIEAHVGRKLDTLGYNTDTSGLRYRRILLPVYILHYTYNGRAMQVVSCGLHGQTYGERPFSHWKLLGLSAILTAMAMALGLAWGAMGVL